MKEKCIRTMLVLAVCAALAGFGAAAMAAVTTAQVYAAEPDAASDGQTEINNGIPVVELSIDPDEYEAMIGSEGHEYRALGASINIYVPQRDGGYTNEFSNEALSDQTDLPLEYIRGRGNSTWEDNKKPFKFKLEGSTDLLGMGKNKHWVLLANSYDDSLLRNRIAMYMARELGMPYTPKMVPVDFVVNGKYQGSYYLGEQVRIGKNRVAIDELSEKDTKEPEVTGGYLLGVNPYNTEPEENMFQTSRAVNFKLDTPAFAGEDAGTPEQRDYITSYLQKTEDAIYGEGMKDADGTPYTDYMDIESAAKYWWVQEFSGNGDAFRTPSTYLYKVRGGKLYWGPAWDFDLAYQTGEQNGSLNMTGFEWLDHMREYDPEYRKLLRSTWDDVKRITNDLTKAGGVLDQYAQETKASWEMDRKLWKSNEPADFDETIEEMRGIIKGRSDAIAESVDEEIGKVYVTVTFMDGDEVLKTMQCKIGDLLPEGTPEIKKDGEYFVGWEDENGELIEMLSSFFEDTVLHARFLKTEDLIEPEEIYFSSDEVWSSIENNGVNLECTIVPKEAQNKEVSWESSDPEVADIDETSGDVTIHKAGTVRFIATSYSGLSRSVTYHFYDPKETTLNKVESIVPEADTLELTPGGFGQMKYSLEPAPAYEDVSFESSDESVCYFIEGNIITGAKPGTCTITMTGNESEKEAQFTVVVKDNRQEILAAKEALARDIIAVARDLAGGRYTEESFKAVQEAAAAANKVIDDTGASMRQVTYAQKKLLREWRRIVPIDQAAEDESARRTEAAGALADAVFEAEGLNVSGYKVSSTKALKDALAAARALLADSSAASGKLTSAKADIAKAKLALMKKDANKLTVKTKVLKVKAKKKGKKRIVKKTRKFSVKKAFKVTKATGKVTYAKKSGNKKITVSSAGKVTVKKGLKKGTYTVKVQVKAAGDANTLAGTKVVRLKVRVK